MILGNYLRMNWLISKIKLIPKETTIEYVGPSIRSVFFEVYLWSISLVIVVPVMLAIRHQLDLDQRSIKVLRFQIIWIIQNHHSSLRTLWGLALIELISLNWEYYRKQRDKVFWNNSSLNLHLVHLTIEKPNDPFAVVEKTFRLNIVIFQIFSEYLPRKDIL